MKKTYQREWASNKRRLVQSRLAAQRADNLRADDPATAYNLRADELATEAEADDEELSGREAETYEDLSQSCSETESKHDAGAYAVTIQDTEDTLNHHTYYEAVEATELFNYEFKYELNNLNIDSDTVKKTRTRT